MHEFKAVTWQVTACSSCFFVTIHYAIINGLIHMWGCVRMKSIVNQQFNNRRGKLTYFSMLFQSIKYILKIKYNDWRIPRPIFLYGRGSLMPLRGYCSPQSPSDQITVFTQIHPAARETIEKRSSSTQVGKRRRRESGVKSASNDRVSTRGRSFLPPSLFNLIVPYHRECVRTRIYVCVDSEGRAWNV